MYMLNRCNTASLVPLFQGPSWNPDHSTPRMQVTWWTKTSKNEGGQFMFGDLSGGLRLDGMHVSAGSSEQHIGLDTILALS